MQGVVDGVEVVVVVLGNHGLVEMEVREQEMVLAGHRVLDSRRTNFGTPRVCS